MLFLFLRWRLLLGAADADAAAWLEDGSLFSDGDGAGTSDASAANRVVVD